MVNYIFNEGEIRTIWKHSKNKRYEIKSYINKEGYVKYVVFYDKQAKKPCTGKIVSKFSEGEVYHWPRLHHKNLARLSDVIYLDERLGIYMTAHFTLSLRELIHKEDFINDPLCFLKKKIFVEDILLGMDYLHSKNLSLMKVTDDTIFISQELDKAVISDFTCLAMVQNAIRHKRCVSLLNKAPEFTTSTPYAQADTFDPICADIWSVGILILETFMCHLVPWGYVDYDSSRALEVCAKIHRDSLQLANRGAVITTQHTDSFKNFVSSFLDTNPSNRCPLKCAVTKQFIKCARREIEKVTLPSNRTKDKLCLSNTCNNVKTKDDFSLCKVYKNQSKCELETSKQAQLNPPQEIISEANLPQNNSIFPKIEVKSSDYNMNLSPNKNYDTSIQINLQNDIHILNKNEVNLYKNKKPKFFEKYKHVNKSQKKVDETGIHTNNISNEHVEINKNELLNGIHNETPPSDIGERRVFQKFENDANITEARSLTKMKDNFKIDFKQNSKHSFKQETNRLLNLLVPENKLETIQNSVSSSTLKMASQLPSSAPVLRHLMLSGDSHNPTINDHTKIFRFRAKLPDKDVNYSKSKVNSNHQIFSQKNGNDILNNNSKSSTSINETDKSKVNENSIRVSVGTSPINSYVLRKTDFSNVFEPSTNHTFQTEIKTLNVDSNSIKSIPLPLNAKKFTDRRNETQSLPRLSNRDISKCDETISLGDFPSNNLPQKINEHEQQSVYPLRVIKHKRGCPHYRHIQAHRKRYRSSRIKQMPSSTDKLNSKQNCEVSKFLLETEEENLSKKSQDKCYKNKKKNKKVRAKQTDIIDEFETKKPHKIRKHFCFG